MDQSRTHNLVNELTGISETGGQSAWADPSYNAMGNMTTVPKPACPDEIPNFDETNRSVSRVAESSGIGVS